jgi:hypothetical protein
VSSDVRLAIERFLKSSRQPVLLEPGDDPLTVAPETFAVNSRGDLLTIECWSETRNLVRRVRCVKLERRGRLELQVERFGSSAGVITFMDLADPSNREADRRGARLKYREVFRRSLRRQFPDWRIVELSTEPDLHHSLSPSYPRALLRKGNTALAAIGASEDALAPEACLSFGLIWLDYLRHREPRLTVDGLAIFVPAAAAAVTCHRVRYLSPKLLVFVHQDGFEDQVDPRDYTNFDTRLDACREPVADERVDRISQLENVERRDRADGSVSLAVNGLEFARLVDRELLYGIDHKLIAGSAAHFEELAQLARGLARLRGVDAADRDNPLYRRHPEAWLESRVRGNVEEIDAALLPHPVYGQVPHFAGVDRSVIDLLAVERTGRLAVIEIKAAQDIHLPLQALDYWMRVKWHLDRGEFAGRGYFPGVEIVMEAPRLLLVAPALDWHPSNETVLGYFAKEVQAERVGVGLEWKRDLRVMFHSPSTPWHLP